LGELGQLLDYARLDAEPVQLLDDGRFFSHRDSPVVAALGVGDDSRP
jgi:hypothetical protein